MTPEELLVPRYKVSDEGYPDMLFEKGEILTLEYRDGINTEWFYQYPKANSLKGRLYKEYFELYPSIFKPLFWWEERKVEDMPEYVKNRYNNAVYKVGQWEKGTDIIYFYTNNRQSYMEMDATRLPATEQEYNEYISNTIKTIQL